MPQKDTSKFVASLTFEERKIITEFLDNSNQSLNELTHENLCTLLTKQNLESLGIKHSQNGSEFSLSKKIKFCVCPYPNVEVWMIYNPSDEYFVNSELLDRLSNEIKAMIDVVIEGYCDEFKSLTCKSPLYLRIETLQGSMEKLKSQLVSEKWLKEAHIEPLDFPLTRGMDRELVIYAGPTNSGKTYHALNHFKEANSGIYVGPLRLNALEVFESLNEVGVPCNLLTGEEKRYIEGAMHTASTVELMDFKKLVDVVLVDEAQFIDDEERGYSFLDSIAGARAKKIIVTCPAYAVSKLERVARLIGIPSTVHLLDRKTKLSVTSESLPSYKDVKEGTAVVAFSKRRLLELKQMMPKDFNVSVIYGSLPPEVKREQARRFRDGKSKIVLATDSIGIGLNLPIKHMVFDTVEKFDGVSKRKLDQQEALQLAGRAGRYGLYEEGFVSGVTEKDHMFLKATVGVKDMTEMLGKFYIRVPYEVIESYMVLTNGNLPECTRVVYENISYDKSRFQLSGCESLLENLRFIERATPDTDAYLKWRCAHIPIEIEECEDVFRECLYVLNGLSSCVEIDSSVLNSSKPYESLFEGYQKLLADIDCVTWFMSSLGVEFDNLSAEEIEVKRMALIQKINSTLVQR